MSSSNTTAQAQPTAAAAVPSLPRTVDQARTAWVTASRDAELDRWHELYDRVVPAPLTSMTTRERYDAGWAARDADERARYRELDACSLRNGAEPEAGQ
jgi:hypothetical protein